MFPPYPQRDRKRRRIWAVCRNHRIKRVVPCRCLDGHIKEPYEMSMAWEPDRRSNFFFSPPAHICAVTYEHAHEKTSGPLWHFTFRDAICLYSYNVCKNGDLTIFWKWNTVARMLYFNCMRHYLTHEEFFQLPDTKFCANLKMCSFSIREVFTWARSYMTEISLIVTLSN